MPVALMGLHPFRAFPLPRSRSASRRPQPSWRCRRTPVRRRWPRSISPSAVGRDGTAYVTVPGATAIAFKAWRRAEVRSPRVEVSHTTGSLLSWDSRLFRAPRQSVLEAALPPPLLSWAFLPRSSHLRKEGGLTASAALQSLTRTTSGAAGSHPRRDPPEVFDLVLLLVGLGAPPVLAYRFTFSPGPRHRAPRAVFGPSRLPAGAR